MPVKNKQKKNRSRVMRDGGNIALLFGCRSEKRSFPAFQTSAEIASFFFSLNEGQVALKMVSVIGFCADVVQMCLRCTCFFCFLWGFFSVSAVKKKIPTCYFHNLVCPCGKGGGAGGSGWKNNHVRTNMRDNLKIEAKSKPPRRPPKKAPLPKGIFLI